MFSSLIDFLFAKRIEIVPISSKQIFFSVVIKLIDIGQRFENKLWLLQRYCKTSKSKYYIFFLRFF